MKRKFSRGSTSRRRIGIHFAIPILLLFCGLSLILYSGWTMFHQAYSLSKVLIQPIPTQETNVPATGVVKAIKFPQLGESFGSISIPSASIDFPLIHGDYDEELAKGVGHFDGSKFPGEGGNIVLAGHRETVFINLGKIKVGDPITVQTTYGTYKYRVTELKIVKANDQTIVLPSNVEKLTLYTCYPFNTPGYKPERYIVWAKLIEGTPMKQLLEGKGK